METFDVVVVGAGAAGMMCAVEAGKRGRRVLVADHANTPGEKIRISGGGRCNFTNLGCAPEAFLSENPRFCLSALRRYTPQDFLNLVERHHIAWREKALGQLFCEGSARQVVDLFRHEMREKSVTLRLGVSVGDIVRTSFGYELSVGGAMVACSALVIATGGKSIPKMGATGFGYDVAARFGLAVTPTRPALVPLMLAETTLGASQTLAGLSLDARVSYGGTYFEEPLLFTHRGLSGPSVLQISSYWREGDAVEIDLAPSVDIYRSLKAARAENARQGAQTALARYVPRRLAQTLVEQENAPAALAETSDFILRRLAERINGWRVIPAGSEGYRTAEVTLGGVDTRGLEQKTMEARTVPGLYFIGEVVDVTGWLGGYNFQWAWASGWAAGQVV